MTNISDAVAAPSAVTFSGKEYRLTPLTEGDFGEFERWMQDHHMELAKRHLTGVPAEVASDLYKHAYDQAMKISITSKEALQMLNSLDGAVMLISLMLRKHHPDMGTEVVRTILSDADNFKQAMAALERLTPQMAESGEDDSKKVETTTQEKSTGSSRNGTGGPQTK